jgi:methyl-accepting chemotaxis protein
MSLGAQHQAEIRFIDEIESKFLPALEAGDGTAARAILSTAHALYQQHRAGVDATVRSSTTVAGEAMSAFDGQRAGTRRTSLVRLGAGAALLLAVFVFVRRSLHATQDAEPETLDQAAASLASGDLTMPVGGAEPRGVAASLEAMRRQRRGIIDTTRRSANEVLTASREIEHGTQHLGQRTEQKTG